VRTRTAISVWAGAGGEVILIGHLSFLDS
jgi:hypothetical protein